MSRDILTPEPYRFDDDFEQTVVALCCRSTRFWQQVGYEIEPDLLPTETARTVMRAVRMVASTAGRPPSLARVRQRLTTLNADGRLADEKLEAALLYMDRAPTSQDFDDACMRELTPLLQRRYSQQVALAAAGEYGAGSAFPDTKKLIARLEAVGQEPLEEDEDGMSFDSPDFDERMSSVTLGEKLPWGIPDVDNSIRGGGIGRGCVAMLVSSTGGGKTRGLIHAACTALRLGRDVAIVTLEWRVEEMIAGMLANLSGCTFDEAIREPARWRDFILRSGVCRGKFVVKWFRPKRTTIEQVLAWGERALPSAEVLVIDFLDKLSSAAVQVDKSMASYNEGMDVSVTLETYTKARNIWCWTASQATRQKNGGKLLKTDDTGLSMGKPQTADYVFTLNFDEETQMLTYNLDKVRWGKGKYKVGPLPHDWDRCRMCPLGDDREIDVEVDDEG